MLRRLTDNRLVKKSGLGEKSSAGGGRPEAGEWMRAGTRGFSSLRVGRRSLGHSLTGCPPDVGKRQTTKDHLPHQPSMWKPCGIKRMRTVLLWLAASAPVFPQA